MSELMNPLTMFLVSLLSAGIGAYVGTYLREKGKNLATHEDIDRVVRATEQIKAQIAGDLSIRQRKRELQIEAMKDMSRVFSRYIQAETEGGPLSDEFRAKYYDCALIVRALFTDATWKQVAAAGKMMGDDFDADADIGKFTDLARVATKAMIDEITGENKPPTQPSATCRRDLSSRDGVRVRRRCRSRQGRRANEGHVDVSGESPDQRQLHDAFRRGGHLPRTERIVLRRNEA